MTISSFTPFLTTSIAAENFICLNVSCPETSNIFARSAAFILTHRCFARKTQENFRLQIIPLIDISMLDDFSIAILEGGFLGSLEIRSKE